MSRKKLLRIITLVMFMAAALFVAAALSAPSLGQVIRIGNFSFGPQQWRRCYLLYLLIMIALFAASFWVKDPKGKQ